MIENLSWPHNSRQIGRNLASCKWKSTALDMSEVWWFTPISGICVWTFTIHFFVNHYWTDAQTTPMTLSVSCCSFWTEKNTFFQCQCDILLSVSASTIFKMKYRKHIWRGAIHSPSLQNYITAKLMSALIMFCANIRWVVFELHAIWHYHAKCNGNCTQPITVHISSCYH